MIQRKVAKRPASPTNHPVRFAHGLFALKRPALALALAAMLSGCGGMPEINPALAPAQDLGHDWRKHYAYGLRLLDEQTVAKNSHVFARAAFSSAARFSRDYSPAFVGLGIAEMRLGNFANAEIAFLNAALIDNRSRYWAYGAIAALNNGDELVARAFFDGMRGSLQEADDASNFVRALYQVQGYPGPIERRSAASALASASAGLICDGGEAAPAAARAASSGSAFGSNAGAGDYVDDEDEDEDYDDEDEDSAALRLGADRLTVSTKGAIGGAEICRNLNIVANVYFVRRYSSDASQNGTDFFKDLTFQLNAVSSKDWERQGEDLTETFLNQIELSIPEIQYALRVTPQLTKSTVQVSAAPSVMTSIGSESQIKEGSDLTILYNASGDAEQFTARTGMVLHLRPERATPDYVKLGLNFEYSAVSSIEPTGTAQVLGVSTNSYSITGTFPYGRPVVLGTISTGTQSYASSGQMGLSRLPGLGGAFGASQKSTSAADTIVLGVLTEPEAFRGTRERRMLQVMQQKGVKVQMGGIIERRKSVHTAPNVAREAAAFLASLPPLVE